MELDDDVCLCFHVTRRKLENFLRVERPSRASQLSQCGGAGTGCGWCVRVLETMFRGESSDGEQQSLPSAAEHASHRKRYIAEKK